MKCRASSASRLNAQKSKTKPANIMVLLGLSAQLARQESASVMERAKTQSADPKINAMEVQRMLNQIGAANGE